MTRLALFLGWGVLLVLLGIRLHRRFGLADQLPGNAPATPSTDARRLLLATTVLAVLAVVLRGLLAAVLSSPERYELTSLPIGVEWTHRLFTAKPPADSLAQWHLPLQTLLAYGWGRLGDLLGLPFSLAWLRLPIVALAAVQVFLVARIGARVASPAAGLAAALLVAVLPVVLRVSVYQKSYPVEMLATTFFVERLSAVLYTGTARLSGLAVSAVLVAWSGVMGGPVVVVGGAVFLVVAVRKGRSSDAIALAAFALLAVVPLAVPLAAGARTYAMSHPVTASGGYADLWSALKAGSLALLLPVGALATAWTRRGLFAAWVGVLALVVLMAYVASFHLCNLAPLFPLAILVGLIGLDDALLACRRRVSARARLAGVGGFVLACVGGAILTSWPRHEGVAGLMTAEPFETKMAMLDHLRPIDDLVRDPNAEPVPVVLVVENAQAAQYVLCPDPTSFDGVLSCWSALPALDAQGFYERVVGRRRVLVTGGRVETTPPLPDFDVLLARPDLGAAPFVLLGLDDDRFVAPSRLLDALATHRIACRPRSTPHGIKLIALDCGPLTR